MTARLLSVGGALKRYGNTLALDGASLELLPGEVHALMGENGAGKSTLIKILAGVTRADEVTLRLRGRPILIGSASDALRAGLRFVHQELNVVPSLSVGENLSVGTPYPRRAGFLIDWPRLNAAASRALAKLGVTHREPHTKVSRLGTGDRMLVQIAAALSDHGTGSVYVMDEPTAALTGEESARLFGVIERLVSSGCAVLYVTHRMDEVFAICDRVTVMRDGRTVSTTATADVTKPELIRLMTGRTLAEAYPARTTPVGETNVLRVTGVSGSSVRNVTFTLREGEILGVAGLAGAGQNALLRLLMGDKPCAEGGVTLGERPFRGDPAAAWRRGLAFIPEERRAQGLVVTRSVRDNVTLPHLERLSRAGFWTNRRRENRLSRQQSDAVRLRATGPDQIVAQLSGGNQQKVMFARVTAGHPRVLLLSEPTRGVDVGAKHDIYKLIRELSASGVGIVIASSDFPELLGLCDRVLVMREGLQAGVIEATDLSPERLLGLCYGDDATSAARAS
ncbi:MAG TPA: sugar ABC transporter ATP-binding protein [Chloroflexota bacterium]|nr:sugar ABC transporter ATP-binding protein [Chloroflexota bacterium]